MLPPVTLALVLKIDCDMMLSRILLSLPLDFDSSDRKAMDASTASVSEAGSSWSSDGRPRASRLARHKGGVEVRGEMPQHTQRELRFARRNISMELKFFSIHLVY